MQDTSEIVHVVPVWYGFYFVADFFLDVVVVVFFGFAFYFFSFFGIKCLLLIDDQLVHLFEHLLIVDATGDRVV